MNRYLMTHSLMSSWLYAMKENPYEDLTTERDPLAELLGFNKKNENEMVWFADFGSFQYINSPDSISGGKLKSALNGTYSLDIAATYYQESNITVDYALDTMSIVGGSDFMIKYAVKQGAFTVKFIKAYDNAVNMRYVDKTVSLPTVTSRAKVFPDACIYIPDRLLWLFFIGTGIVFTTDLNDASRYGFLDTRSTIGTISKYGYLEYDGENDSIIVAGQDTGKADRMDYTEDGDLGLYAGNKLLSSVKVSGGTGSGYGIGHGLEVKDGDLTVVTTDDFSGDNTLPMTAAGVETIVGNIEVLLGTPDAGYYGLSDVTVAAIPESYQDVSAVTAEAGNVLTGKVFVDAEGVTKTGTMPNNGALSKTIDGLTAASVEIPAGYTSGGTVSLTGDIEEALAAI